MSTTTYAGIPFETDAEGFLADPSVWTRDVGEAIAAASGIPVLTTPHWQVVEFMRQRYLETGSAPTVRGLGTASGVSVKELYALFPKGPAKLAAKIGGIPKPKGCI